MWQDNNNKIIDILDNLEISNKECFPVVCPICKKKGGHLYFHRNREMDERGSMWAWCSACCHFTHVMCRLPKWWENLEEVNVEKLTSYPNYLEENKINIDAWINKLISLNLINDK